MMPLLGLDEIFFGDLISPPCDNKKWDEIFGMRFLGWVYLGIKEQKLFLPMEGENGMSPLKISFL